MSPDKISEGLESLFAPNPTHQRRAAVLDTCKAVRAAFGGVRSLQDASAIDGVFDDEMLAKLGHCIRTNSFLYPRAVYLIAECFWQADTALAFREKATDFALRPSTTRRWRRPWVAMLCAEYHALATKQDRGAALWWGALGYIADVMAGPEYAESSGNENLLRFALGVPDATFELLRGLAEAARDRSVADSDVSRLEHTPESVLVEAFQHAAALPLIGPSQEYTYPACRAFVAAARRVVADQSVHSSGWLERLAHYLFMTVPGMRSKRNMVTEERSSELDLFITRMADNAYHVPVTGGRWIAECKSSAKTLEAEHVGHFLAKMSYYRADFGVFIGNVAGDGPKLDDQLSRFSAALVRGHDRSSDRPCVTVGLSELVEIEKEQGGISFRELLSRKFDVLRYGHEKAAPKPRKQGSARARRPSRRT